MKPIANDLAPGKADRPPLPGMSDAAPQQRPVPQDVQDAADAYIRQTGKPTAIPTASPLNVAPMPVAAIPQSAPPSIAGMPSEPAHLAANRAAIQSTPPMPGAVQQPSTGTAPPPIINWVGAGDLRGDPPAREWLVTDIIPNNNVTLLYGDGGTGKSQLALQLAVATVLGTMWLNRMPMNGAAIYFSAEDDRGEMHNRLADIAKLTNSTIDQIMNGLTIADMVGLPSLLAEIDHTSKLLKASAVYRHLEAKIAEKRPKLVVLDTLADVFPGNENDRAQASQFITMLRRLAGEYRCAVVLCAHPSQSGLATGTGSSGSTGWSNKARSRLYFSRIVSDGYESDPNARRLVVKKNNYGPTNAEINVAWQRGVFIAQQDSQSDDTTTRAERIFMTLLERSAAQGRYFHENYAPGEFAKMPGCEGLTKPMLKSAMERLFASDKIMIVTITENRRERKIIKISG